MRLDIKRIGLALFSSSWVALGVLCLVIGDFLRQYEPVAASVPRFPLAVISAVMLVACGLGLMFARTRRLAALALSADLIIWILVLQPMVIFKAPGAVFTWLPLGELGALLSGALVILSITQGWPSLPFSDGRTARAAQVLFSLCCFEFAASHFVYASATAAFIPDWIPARLFLAYLTGAGHFFAGLAILTGIQAKLAARLEALMMSTFVLLVHVPSLFLKELPFWAPDHITIYMALLIAISLAGSAWSIAASIKPRADFLTAGIPAIAA
jgi:uncharacterized membrane protein YphA (DoxX/SURF4 family)